MLAFVASHARQRLVLVLIAVAPLAACSKPRSRAQTCADGATGPVFPPRPAPRAQDPSTFDRALAPLSTVPVPKMADSDVIDEAAAVVLGKAFFWDMQAGSDGQTACASCHFHAGADNRTVNTINPGPDGQYNSFNGPTGPGEAWNGKALQGDDIIGSQGVVRAIFRGLNPDPKNPAEICDPQSQAPYYLQRQVGGRNAPSVIGAIFNRANFWDGRASPEFNGFDPFGAYGMPKDLDGSTASCGQREVVITDLIDNASLASQAVGPPMNELEMTCVGRPLEGPSSLGAKLVDLQPLALQQVAKTDGVLGPYSAAPANGMLCAGRPCTYRDLIAKAFGPEFAASAQDRFGRIWGQALQSYEATLIPDQTPLDKFLEGNTAALSASQQLGLQAFQTTGNCIKCHAGPTLSDASIWFAEKNGLVNEDGGDQGYHNIGVRPTEEDIGRAAKGPSGLTYSETGNPKDRGAFKTAALRNVGLTAPYFHAGTKATILDVITFYVRGGDFPNPELSSSLKRLNLSTAETLGLIDFLQNGLTDCRVQNEHAPFDHPSLSVPNGANLPAVGAGGTAPCP